MGKWKAIRSNNKFKVDPNVEAHRGMWKGMKHESEKIRLYDLSKDLGEKKNLADKHPEVVAKIAELMPFQAHTPCLCVLGRFCHSCRL